MGCCSCTDRMIARSVLEVLKMLFTDVIDNAKLMYPFSHTLSNPVYFLTLNLSNL